MTVKELYAYIEKKAPSCLSAGWDNDGMACCTDESRCVKKVLIALDATERVVEKAVSGGFDVLLTHHPLLFKGVKELTPRLTVSRKLLKLIAGGVTAMSFHTRLDAADGGVTDVLATLFGLQDVQKVGPEGEEMARLGTLPAPVPARDFAQTVCEKLNIPSVLLVGDRTVRRVMMLGGEGADFVGAATARGDVDLFLAGRIGYHRMLDGAEEGLALIEAGHFATERPVCYRLAEWVKEADPAIEVEIDTEPTIKQEKAPEGSIEK